MQIEEIRKVFDFGDKQQVEMMARGILTRGRTHVYMHDLSKSAKEFNDLLRANYPHEKDHLALVYILAEHLIEIRNGACACSIVYKPMYNSPDRLAGILEILTENFNNKEYCIFVHSRCLACGKEYESKTFESGFGQKVIWAEIRE
jgi:hypothetical protein